MKTTPQKINNIIRRLGITDANRLPSDRTSFYHLVYGDDDEINDGESLFDAQAVAQSMSAGNLALRVITNL